MEILIFLVIAILVLVGAYYSYLGQQQRTKELADVATRLGWEFDADEDYEHDSRYQQFGEFSQGHSRYAYNTLHGSIDVGAARWPVKMGDFHYATTSHNGKHTTTHHHHFSYVALHPPYRQLPDLLIRREGLFDAFKNLFGFDDIDFESAEFSRRFCVKSADRRFAYDVIHAKMIEFLLEYEPPAIDVQERVCLLHGGGSSWTPAEFRATVDWARHFFELWPAHVTSQLEHQP
jgi:hypothetical protein